MHQFTRIFFGRLTLAVIAFCIASTVSNAANRVALVIGNANYQNGDVLKNPVNDANLIADALEREGFEVTKVIEANYKTMNAALLEFISTLGYGPEASLIYYSGHGIQVNTENYLIPIDADFTNLEAFSSRAIKLHSILSMMGASKSKLNIVLLDASRDNPFNAKYTSDKQGLAGVFAPNGHFFFGFAAAPGRFALDGDGDNSPYATAIAELIKTPGIKIERTFSLVRRAVFNATNGKQIPWDNSSFGGDFRFHPVN